MSDLITEIKEELSRERVSNLAHKYMPFIAITVVAIIAFTALGLWYNHYKLNQVHADGGQYLTAIGKMRAENLAEGLTRFEGLREGTTNYAALGKFNLASYEIFNKNFVKASGLLKEIASEKSYHTTLRNLASLYDIQISYEAQLITSQEAIQKVEHYLKSPTEFAFTARELLALLYLSSGDKIKAEEILTALSTNPQTPSSITKRSKQYLALIY